MTEVKDQHKSIESDVKAVSELIYLIDQKSTNQRASEKLVNYLDEAIDGIIENNCCAPSYGHDYREENVFKIMGNGTRKSKDNNDSLQDDFDIYEPQNIINQTGAAEDIVLEKQSEDRLKYLESVVNGMDESVLVVDRQYQVVFMNRKAKFGFLFGNGFNNSISDKFCYSTRHGLNQPCSMKGLNCPLGKVFESGKPVRVKHKYSHLNGDESIVEILASPLFDKTGETIGVIEVGRDLPPVLFDEENGKQQLDFQLNKEESIARFISGIAHHFNNYIMGVAGSAELIKEKGSDQEDLLKYSELILKSSWRMSDLIKNLVLCAKKDPIHKTKTQLNPLLEKVVANEQKKQSVGFTIKKDLSDNLWDVEGNAESLEVLVKALLANACEANVSTDGGVTIKTQNVFMDEWLCESKVRHPSGDYVKLSIIDNGCGISRENMPFIFDPFFSTKLIGRGLGLAVSRKTIKAHEGGIIVNSIDGQGTAMNIYFSRLKA